MFLKFLMTKIIKNNTDKKVIKRKIKLLFISLDKNLDKKEIFIREKKVNPKKANKKDVLEKKDAPNIFNFIYV